MMFDVPVKINNICKKIICGIMVLFVLFSCCACGNRDKSVVSDYEELTINDDDYKFIPVENIEKYQHAEKIIDFDSEISTGYDQFTEWQYKYNKATKNGVTRQIGLTRWANTGGKMNVSLNVWARVKKTIAAYNYWGSWYINFSLNDIKTK